MLLSEKQGEGLRDVKFNQAFPSAGQRQQRRGWLQSGLDEHSGVLVCVCAMVPTIWNLHFSVANELTGEKGLCVSVLNQSVLQHLHHAQGRLEGNRKCIFTKVLFSSWSLTSHSCLLILQEQIIEWVPNEYISAKQKKKKQIKNVFANKLPEIKKKTPIVFIFLKENAKICGSRDLPFV